MFFRCSRFVIPHVACHSDFVSIMETFLCYFKFIISMSGIFFLFKSARCFPIHPRIFFDIASREVLTLVYIIVMAVLILITKAYFCVSTIINSQSFFTYSRVLAHFLIHSPPPGQRCCRGVRHCADVAAARGSSWLSVLLPSAWAGAVRPGVPLEY